MKALIPAILKSDEEVKTLGCQALVDICKQNYLLLSDHFNSIYSMTEAFIQEE